MVKISSFQEVVTPISIEIDGLIINMKVRKNFMTPNMQLTLIEAAKEPETQIVEALRQFCMFVEWWDIVDDDDVMVPIDADVLNGMLPINVLFDMMSKSVDAIRALGK